MRDVNKARAALRSEEFLVDNLGEFGFGRTGSRKFSEFEAVFFGDMKKHPVCWLGSVDFFVE